MQLLYTLAKMGLNPYSNGMKNVIEYEEDGDQVLILILME